MSEPPIYDPQPDGIYNPPVLDNSPKVLRFVIIINYISTGIDALTCLALLFTGAICFVAPEMAPHNAGEPPTPVMGVIYITAGVLTLVFGIIKLIGTRKLQGRGPTAWAWGIAVGIIGCLQLPISCLCLQVVPGIYTLVVLSMKNVRAYLAALQQPHDLPPPSDSV